MQRALDVAISHNRMFISNEAYQDGHEHRQRKAATACSCAQHQIQSLATFMCRNSRRATRKIHTHHGGMDVEGNSLMQIFQTLQDLPGVLLDYLLVQRTKPCDQVCDASPRHMLHCDSIHENTSDSRMLTVSKCTCLAIGLQQRVCSHG